MIKIKDYILNENDIDYIYKGDYCLYIYKKVGTRELTINKGSFEDIEWNYGTPQETHRKMQKELCKSCYYRDTISNHLKELEEENKKLANQINEDIYKPRIDKSLEYIEEHKRNVYDTFGEGIVFGEMGGIKELLKILKGEEK